MYKRLHSLAVFQVWVRERLDEAEARHAKVARDAKVVAWPLMCAEANATAAYARAVSKEAYGKQSFSHSLLIKHKDWNVWPDAFPEVDFHFWAEYGSWSQSYNCRSFFSIGNC